MWVWPLMPLQVIGGQNSKATWCKKKSNWGHNLTTTVRDISFCMCTHMTSGDIEGYWRLKTVNWDYCSHILPKTQCDAIFYTYAHMTPGSNIGYVNFTSEVFTGHWRSKLRGPWRSKVAILGYALTYTSLTFEVIGGKKKSSWGWSGCLGQSVWLVRAVRLGQSSPVSQVDPSLSWVVHTSGLVRLAPLTCQLGQLNLSVLSVGQVDQFGAINLVRLGQSGWLG